MTPSFVIASQDTPFSHVLKGDWEGYPLDDWRDPFPGAGWIKMSEAVRNVEDFNLAQFEFIWGPEARENEFKSFQRRQLDDGFAICESFDTAVGTRVLVALRPQHSGIEAMLCLERAVRRLNQKNTIATPYLDGTIHWVTDFKGDKGFMYSTTGKRETDYVLWERWSMPS